APRSFEDWTTLLQHSRPNVTHRSKHGPIDEPDQVRAFKTGSKFLQPKALLDVLPIHLLQGLMLAEHDFAILKLQGVRVARFGDGMDLSAAGKTSEDRMYIGVAQQAEVGDFESEAGQGIGHDRAVAPEFGHLAAQFDV